MAQDITPSKKSIRQIILNRDPDDIRQAKPETHEPRMVARERKAPGFFARKSLWIVALVCVLVLYVTFGIFFAGAKIVVTPRQEAATLDGRFVALKDAAPTELAYQLMTFEKEQSTTLPSTGESQVEEKASGVITISNNQGKAPEHLIKNTRFETSDGLIYRIKDAVVVPGQKTVNGETVPGTIDATVYADAAGEKYNIGSASFTIPGLKGDARFTTLTAQSKTAMTGGRIGLVKTVSPEAEKAARETVRAALVEGLEKDARAQVPEGFVLYDGASFTEYVSGPNANADAGVTITEKGIFRGIIFNGAALAHAVAANTVARFDGEEVRIPEIEKLSFALIDKEGMHPESDTRIEFTLRGNPNIVWHFDGDRLKEDLVGKTKRMINTVLAGYPGIEKAEVIIRPFWKTSFPKKAEKINVETLIEEPGS